MERHIERQSERIFNSFDGLVSRYQERTSFCINGYILVRYEKSNYSY